MRYYAINVTDPATNKPLLDAAGQPIGSFYSYALGQNVPGALNVEWDIPVTAFDRPIGAAFLRIWGVGITAVGQSTNFNGQNIEIYGGMAPGLPLANPKQAGLLLKGNIYQAYGNWQGLEQTLDFQIYVPTGSPQAPLNLVFSLATGQNLQDAIQATLGVAFPESVINIAISPDLISPYDTQPSFYNSMAEFSVYIRSLSQSIINKSGYPGISINATYNGFQIIDGTVRQSPKQIQFTDLIGQPTWLSLSTISFKTVMRADIAFGDYVLMPQTPQINTQESFSQFRNKAIFQGQFFINSVRHLGHFRQRSADAWVTVFEATTVQA